MYIRMQNIEEVIKDQTPYIFGRLCSERETPTTGTQILARTSVYGDSVHELLQSTLLQSESYHLWHNSVHTRNTLPLRRGSEVVRCRINNNNNNNNNK